MGEGSHVEQFPLKPFEPAFLSVFIRVHPRFLGSLKLTNAEMQSISSTELIRLVDIFPLISTSKFNNFFRQNGKGPSLGRQS